MRTFRVLIVLLVFGVIAATGLLGADAWRKVQDSSLELTGDPSRLYSAPPRLAVGAPLERFMRVSSLLPITVAWLISLAAQTSLRASLLKRNYELSMRCNELARLSRLPAMALMMRRH